MRKSLKRLAAPETVQEAKRSATRLQEFLSHKGLKLSRSHCLEALASLTGHKDWNTMNAAIGQRTHDVDEEAETRKLARIMSLNPANADECANFIISLCYSRENCTEEEIWFERAVWAVRAVVYLYHSFHVHQKLEMTPSGLRDAMQFDAFLDLLRQAEELRLPEEDLRAARSFLTVLPGFSYEDFHACEKQSTKAYEMYGFVTMTPVDKINRLIAC
jgi:hypothetical protein